MPTLRIPGLALCLLLLASAASAQSPDRWTIDAILKQESITEASISPDGRRLLWVKRSPDTDRDRFTTDVFLTLLDERTGELPETIQLTRTGDNTAPNWSPDGRRIAFASTRTDGDVKGRQIWLMDARGGEPRAITTLETGINSLAWLDDARILFTAREGKTAFERAAEKGKDDALAVEDTTLFSPVRLFSLNVADRKIHRVSDNAHRVGEFAADPTGRYVVYSLAISPITADARSLPTQHLLDLQNGSTVEIFPGRYFPASGFRWAADGSGFFASAPFSSDPQNAGAGIQKLYWFDVARGEHEKVDLAWPNGLGAGGYAVVTDGIHVNLANGTRMEPRFITRRNGAWVHEQVNDYRFRHSTSIDVGPDGRTIIFNYSRPDSIPRYYAGTYDRGQVHGVSEFVRLNGYLNELPIPRAEVIEWAGYGGNTVNGILYYPIDYEPGRQYPLVVAIHGGPSSVDLDAWRLDWTIYPGLFAERGAFMLRPNYHGSGHHGLEFVESIKGRYYELELPDIVTGIDHLVGRGMVDREQLGVIGWSNGAILATALTVEHPELFRVAAPGAGNVNWISDYGNCAFGVRFDDSYFGGPPWDRLDHYIEKSPLFRMPNVVTPTLIQFGDQDTAVPTEQGWQHYRALQQIGKAPVRFILYPGVGHGLTRLSHQKRKIQEELDWFDTYLFDRSDLDTRLEDRIIPASSPLAQLDRRAGIAREGVLYGERVRGVLAPEVVQVNDTLHAGRFEVTRAQFRAFRSAYRVPAGTENYPANDISFEDARAYVAWLSRTTGRAYRLPTEAEMKLLVGMASSGENDLAYWAGYQPTADERAVLEARIAGIETDRLLLPVGSRNPANGERESRPLLFDLNGNVAEWAVRPDSSGVALGASAGTMPDARIQDPPAPPRRFTGIRVVGMP
jgi:dipeptidyl aminopeptidase/acylaminoacyl peptidase